MTRKLTKELLTKLIQEVYLSSPEEDAENSAAIALIKAYLEQISRLNQQMRETRISPEARQHLLMAGKTLRKLLKALS